MKKSLLAAFICGLVLSSVCFGGPPSPPGIPATCDGTTCTPTQKVALPTGSTATTQTINDNSTKLATDAYADRAANMPGFTFAGPADGDQAFGKILPVAITVTSVACYYVGLPGGSASLLLYDCADPYTCTVMDVAIPVTDTPTVVALTAPYPVDAGHVVTCLINGSPTGTVVQIKVDTR